MGESQCPHCGHVVSGFEQVEFEVKQDELTQLRAAIERKDSTLIQIAAQFDMYAREHQRKGSLDKAEVNQNFAQFARAALEQE